MAGSSSSAAASSTTCPTDDSCVLEREPLQRLTAEAQLTAYQHGGFWSCVDTLRDREVVQGLWEAGAAPWKG